MNWWALGVLDIYQGFSAISAASHYRFTQHFCSAASITLPPSTFAVTAFLKRNVSLI